MVRPLATLTVRVSRTITRHKTIRSLFPQVQKKKIIIFIRRENILVNYDRKNFFSTVESVENIHSLTKMYLQQNVPCAEDFNLLRVTLNRIN